MSSPELNMESAPPPQPESNRPPVIVIVGPTAVGKTDISIRLAHAMNGEIISADSRLFYRGMDIGTAKPTPNEMAQVPHHLIDVANPDNTWSLAMFQSAAHTAIADIHARGRLPIVVGGTGQYIQAVTQGWTPPATPPNDSLRAVLERMGSDHGTQWLHDKLALIDPFAANSIDHRNVRRTIRALEVIFSTGKRFSEQRGQKESPYHLLTIGLTRPRPELYERVDTRIEKMFADGLLDEVQKLLEQGYTPAHPAMSAIGYRESIAILENEMTLDEAKAQMKRLTRIFVRRQSNWFKENDPSIKWFYVSDDVDTKITEWLRDELLG